jgi:diketogulonate reductase-like aldo/keto reductase
MDPLAWHSLVGTGMRLDSTVPLLSGRSMPVMGLGTWQLTHDTAGTVAEALRLGYRLIDTSGDYGTQPGVGEGIYRSGIGRDEIFLTTKVEETDDAYDGTVRDLRELGLEWADLMLIHRPPRRGVGRELWEGLIQARDEGLTRDIGVSNYTIEQMDELIRATGETPAVNQIEWSPFGWSPEMLSWCRERGIVIQAYSPLTRGRRLDDQRLAEMAAEYGKTPAQLLLRWNVQLGTVPLPKANQMEHLVENAGTFDFEIREPDVERLGQLNEVYSAL